MRILMVVRRLKIGGTEKHILSISRYFKSRGAQIGIAAMNGPLRDTCRSMGVRVHLLSPRNHSLAGQVKELSFIVRKRNYDIVHAHDSKSFRNASGLKRKRPVCLIATVHGSYYSNSSLRAVSKAAKKIIAVSPKLSRWVASKKIPSAKIQLVPNGIDTTIFRPSSHKVAWRKELGLPSNAQILVYASRFDSDKYPVARKVIIAAGSIAKTRPNFVAVLYGPGRYREKLLHLATRINRRLKRTAIYVRSALSQIQHAYYASDVVVGTGRVALEALACAKPVIAVGKSGYCGIVRKQNIESMTQCHFGDHGSVAQTTLVRLVRDIRTLLNKPIIARAVSRFGASFVRNHLSISKVGDKLFRVYLTNRTHMMS